MARLWFASLPVRRQSEHFAEYRQALDRLIARGLAYPCFCTRAQLAAAMAAPHAGEPDLSRDPPGIPVAGRTLA